MTKTTVKKIKIFLTVRYVKINLTLNKIKTLNQIKTFTFIATRLMMQEGSSVWIFYCVLVLAFEMLVEMTIKA